MLTFFIGLVIGLIVGAVSAVLGVMSYGRKLELQHIEAVKRRQQPKSEKEAESRVEKSGPIPSDPEVGAFIGDAEGEARVKAERDAKIAEGLKKGREEHFKHLLTQTRDEDANNVLYFIAVADPEEYHSNRNISKILGWGTPRVAKAIAYLNRNDYIRVNETKGNKGTQYRLLPSKTQKRSA